MIISKQNQYLIKTVLSGFLANVTLKESNGFKNINFVILTVIIFLYSCYYMALIMKENDIGPSYVIYSASVSLALYLYGLIFYKEIPTIYSCIGTIFVISGVYLIKNK